jgi:hypothetical protein
MAPIHRLKRSSAQSESPSQAHALASVPQPSTWSILTTVGGAIWATYMVFESAGRIWNWIQTKLEEKRHQKLATVQWQEKESMKKHPLGKRRLQKRFSAPFSATVKVIHWVTVVVSWIYRHLDSIPHRIQDRVNRVFVKEQDKEWDVKVAEAEKRVKTILAREFPDHYKKEFLDPYEEGSELYEENLDFLKQMQESTNQTESDTIEVHAKW